MKEESYLAWLTGRTKTSWWHDSADPAELDQALASGAVGVTTNPYLANLALVSNRQTWAKEIKSALADGMDPVTRALALMRIPIAHAASRLWPVFEKTGGKQGWVCGQVNPAFASNREAMIGMANHIHNWAPNITVKIPASAAGLDVLEECVAEGISVTLTVSFTVPQVIAIGARYKAGASRASGNGRVPGNCFAVIMIGRLDDYIREVVLDTNADVSEADIRQAGIAVTKRALGICRDHYGGLSLIVAALRGTYHVTELSGGNLILSIAPAFQQPLLSPDIPREERINYEMDTAVTGRLLHIPEFRRAYEPDGMRTEDFFTYGLTQRTLTQFAEAGWKLMENFKL